MKSDAEAPAIRYWRNDAVDGAYFAQASYGPYKFSPHVHDELVIVITESGAGQCATKSGCAIGRPGSTWMFAPGEYHRGEVLDEGEWRYRAVYLDLGHAATQSTGWAENPSGEHALPVAPGLYDDPDLSARLLTALTSLDGASSASLLERQASWCEGFNFFCERYGSAKSSSSAPASGRMSVVRDYLNDNYNRDISIDELGGLVSLSRYHLMRCFTKEYGLPPHAYANQVRLLAAKRLLAGGRTPADAAMEAGFYDQSHLNRMFKRAYGVSPGSFARVAG